MAAEIKTAYGVDAQLIPGSNGIFDVVVDGKKVYSKGVTGRFPEKGEVVKLMQK